MGIKCYTHTQCQPQGKCALNAGHHCFRNLICIPVSMSQIRKLRPRKKTTASQNATQPVRREIWLRKMISGPAVQWSISTAKWQLRAMVNTVLVPLQVCRNGAYEASSGDGSFLLRVSHPWATHPPRCTFSKREGLPALPALQWTT